MLTLDLTNFPILETERLILRQLSTTDTPAMMAMRSNPEVMKYIPLAVAQKEEEVTEYIQSLTTRMAAKECLIWAITLKSDQTMIGTVGFYRMKLEHFRGEAGYMSRPEYNGKGYVTEALQAVVHYGFNEMNLHSIEALIDPDNIGSQRVLEKCGFEKEAHFKENFFYNGVFLDTAVYTKLNK